MGLLPSKKMVRIHKEGHSFLLVLFILFLGINIIFQLSEITEFYLNIILFSSVLIFLFFLQFFRNPKRNTKLNDELIISPARGTYIFFSKKYFREKKTKMKILSVENLSRISYWWTGNLFKVPSR